MDDWHSGLSQDQGSWGVVHNRQLPALPQPPHTLSWLDFPISGELDYSHLDLGHYHPEAQAIADIPIGDLTTGRDAQPWAAGQYDNVQYNTGRFPVKGSACHGSSIKHEGYGTVDVSAASHPLSRAQHSFIDQKDLNNGLKRKASTYATSEAQSQITSNSRRKSTASLEDCNICGRKIKNRSDATKHAKTHERPYKCRVEHCRYRTMGFGTPNDRQRHERCKHNIVEGNASVKGWVCSACSTNTKPWPRLDNFKAHLKRRHTDDDHDQIVMASQRDLHPSDFYRGDRDDVTNGSYYQGTSHADELPYQQEFLQPYPSMLTTRQSVQGGEVMPWLDESARDHLAQVGNASWADIDLSTRSVPPRAYPADGIDDCYPMPPVPVSQLPTLVINNHLNSTSQLLNVERQPEEPEHDSEECKKQPSTKLYVSLEVARTMANACEPCGYYAKLINGEPRELRPSDLTKHKRKVHERPYGCTQPHCYSTSGSKSDWARHERQIHRCPVAFLCREQDAQGEYCNEYFMTDDANWLRKHLRDDHKMPRSSWQQAVEAYKLPRAGMDRFWCGFCDKVVPNPVKEGDEDTAWKNRIAHIGQHMDQKGGWRIQQWVCQHYKQQKGTITKAQKQAQKCRVPPPPLHNEEFC